MVAPVRPRTGPRVWVQSWDPAYGASTEEQTGQRASTVEVSPDVELAESDWRPIEAAPVTGEGPDMLFVDGVRRVDAMGWIATDGGAPGDGSAPGDAPGDGAPAMALFASYAAGVVRCRPGSAEVLDARVYRGLFSGAAMFTGLDTPAGSYPGVPVRLRDTPAVAQQLGLAVVDRMRAMEADLSSDVRAELDGGAQGSLLVTDGPLDDRSQLPRTLGYAKTHAVPYLPPALHRMAGLLPPGRRTPLFGLSGRFPRYSWYLRLPGGSVAPWAGVVRVECWAGVPPTEAVALADLSQPLLCRYASTEYKDSRAPQNLYPIAGLERRLRRRLGDQALLYRAIRRAAV